MRSITLKVPESGGGVAFDYAVYLASKLYEDAEMSSGQAAEVAGLSKRAFIEIMGKYGVSPFSGREDDLLNDIANA
jgi:predicted HTH domain antitoxin